MEKKMEIQDRIKKGMERKVWLKEKMQSEEKE